MNRFQRMLVLASLFGPVAAWAQTICLDPGHSSEVGPGARGKKTTEIKVAWQVALLTKTKLEALGYTVVMTKSRENEHVTNRRRAEIANEAKADLFLRLHLDSASEKGFATYYPDRAATVAGHTGPSAEIRRLSAKIARPFHAAVMKSLAGALLDRRVRSEQQTAIGHKQGALTGSVFSNVPVLLVEMAVLNQKSDEAFVVTEKGRTRIASALVAGIQSVFPLKSDIPNRS